MDGSGLGKKEAMSSLNICNHSHSFLQRFRHPVKTGRVTVPHPKKDMTVRTIKSIEKQSGLRLS
jgi:hypothetical protein